MMLENLPQAQNIAPQQVERAIELPALYDTWDQWFGAIRQLWNGNDANYIFDVYLSLNRFVPNAEAYNSLTQHYPIAAFEPFARRAIAVASREWYDRVTGVYESIVRIGPSSLSHYKLVKDVYLITALARHDNALLQVIIGMYLRLQHQQRALFLNPERAYVVLPALHQDLLAQANENFPRGRRDFVGNNPFVPNAPVANDLVANAPVGQGNRPAPYRPEIPEPLPIQVRQARLHALPNRYADPGGQLYNIPDFGARPVGGVRQYPLGIDGVIFRGNPIVQDIISHDVVSQWLDENIAHLYDFITLDAGVVHGQETIVRFFTMTDAIRPRFRRIMDAYDVAMDTLRHERDYQLVGARFNQVVEDDFESRRAAIRDAFETLPLDMAADVQREYGFGGFLGLILSKFGRTLNNIDRSRFAAIETFDDFLAVIENDTSFDAQTITGALRELYNDWSAGLLDKRFLIGTDGRARQKNDPYRVVDVNNYYTTLEGRGGQAPLNPNVAPAQGVAYLNSALGGVVPSQSVLKTGRQFQDLVDDANDMIDTKLFKVRETLLNHKVDIVSDSLNDLKRMTKDVYNGKIGISRQQLILQEPHKGTFVPMTSVFGVNVFPTRVRINFQRGWTSGQNFGLYYIFKTRGGDAQEDVNTYAMPVMTFGKNYKRTYEFQAAPYFGYTDSIFQMLKVPVLGRNQVMTGALRLTSQGTEVAPTDVYVVRAAGDICPNSKFSASVIGAKQYEAYLNRFSTAISSIAIMNNVRNAIGKLAAVRVPVVRDADYQQYSQDLPFIASNGEQLVEAVRERQFRNVERLSLAQYFSTEDALPHVFARTTSSIFAGLGGDPVIEQIARSGLIADLARLELASDLSWSMVGTAIMSNADAGRMVLTGQTNLYINSVIDFISGIKGDLADLNSFFGVIKDQLVALDLRDGAVRRHRSIQRLEEVISHISSILEPSRDRAGLASLIGRVLALSNLLVRADGNEDDMDNDERGVIALNDALFYDEIDWARMIRVLRSGNFRPLRVDTGTGGEAIVRDSAGLKARLAIKLTSVANDITSNMDTNYLYTQEGALTGYFAMYIPTSSFNQASLSMSVVFEGYSHPVGALKYLQVLSWIRNFNYGSKLERQKISKNRVSTYVNQDTKQLKKLIYTFGGEPTKFIQKG